MGKQKQSRDNKQPKDKINRRPFLRSFFMPVGE
jgi:hypothetical protein